MNDCDEGLTSLLQEVVVLDVVAQYVYLGKLVEVTPKYLVLTDADVHDLNDSNTTRERYVLESKQHGVRVNRKRVLVARTQILSISAVDDVVE